VIYAVFAKIVKKEKITFKNAALVNLSSFSDELMTTTTNEVFNLYMRLGGNDKIAKGSDFIASLKEELALSFAKEIK
jgi:hypothetical protein